MNKIIKNLFGFKIKIFGLLFVIIILTNTGCSIFIKCPVKYDKVHIDFSERFYAFMYNVRYKCIVISENDCNWDGSAELWTYFNKKYQGLPIQYEISIYKANDEIFIKKGNKYYFKEPFSEKYRCRKFTINKGKQIGTGN